MGARASLGSSLGASFGASFGAWLWIGCLQYFLAEALCVAAWRGRYSLRENFISDLGAQRCGAAGEAASGCSTLPALMNASFLLQGALLIGGAWLLARRRPPGRLGAAGFALIGASGLGVALVGLAPEDVAPGWHYAGAAENFLFCNLGAALTGLAFMLQGPSSLRFGFYSLLAGAAGLTGLALIAGSVDFGWGPGAIERIAAYPFPIWVASLGLRLKRTGEAPA